MVTIVFRARRSILSVIYMTSLGHSYLNRDLDIVLFIAERHVTVRTLNYDCMLFIDVCKMNKKTNTIKIKTNK